MMDKSSDYYGEGGRLGSTPQETLIKTAYTHDCADADILLPGLHKADLAHVVMLIEEGVIPKDIGRQLLRGLKKLESIPAKDFPINPAHGDVYNSKDVALKNEIGEVAGWLHIGRARREAVNIAFLIAVRERLLDLAESVSLLATQMIRVAKAERNTLMPDFTYLHHAHPTTVAHYLLTFVYPMLRDADRLKSVFERVNQSPAGSGSVNGSGLPLNRDRLCQLLGFDAVITHTRDAMWQTDVPLEVMSTLVMVLMNINRIADELQIWNTSEFNMIDLDDELCRASVIMPQKKNPYPLAYIRGVTASLSGNLGSFASYGRIVSGNPDSRIFIYGELPRALDKGTGAIDLMSAVFKGLKFNSNVMLQRVQADYSYSTDLAEYLVLHYALDYRSAHQILGMVVRKMLEANLPGDQLSAELLNQTAKEVADIELGLSDNQLKQLIDPRSILNNRQTIGGAAEQRMNEMFEECDTCIESLNNWYQTKRTPSSFTILDKALDDFIG